METILRLVIPNRSDRTTTAPPPLLGWALRFLVVGLLAFLWGDLFSGGFAKGGRLLTAQLGSHAAALGVLSVLGFFLALTTGRVALWLFYRPVAMAESDAGLPTVTAIVPAYNEGAMVRHALLSLATQKYPAERLQIVAIDDGSGDDTYSHMEAAARLHPGRILLLRQPQNRGKRAALEAGFAAARSELVLTCDSDCVLDPNAVRAMVAPFRDAKVGAVAGRVLIHNRLGSWLTRLLAPQFTLTFDFLRAAQSVNGTVLCCPGALSAFRLDVIHRVLPEWLEQRFFGTLVGPGEDRFMTTLILREGFVTRYQATAKVHTLVPTSYLKISKMLLRWDRCDLRESLEALWLLPRRRGLARLSHLPYLAFAVETLLTVPVSALGLLALAALALTHPLTAVWALVGLNVPLGISLLLCLSADFSVETLWLCGYAWVSPIFAWILPFAAVTLNDQAWMSRDLPQAPPLRAAA